METWTLSAPCHFGTEAVLKREIQRLGYEISEVDNGRVNFIGDAEAVALANIHLRTAERIMILVGDFEAQTFDELFEGVKAIHWEDFIPKDGKFWVTKASSVNSKLFSPSDIQSIAKKAMVERMKGVYHIERFEETGNAYPVRILINKNRVMVLLDTTGTSLHKRGYRQLEVEAPISETLAAALIMLTPWKWDRILIDPFCGSGTFPIEAAMMAAHIAPGLNRHFTAESWENIIPKDIWKDVRQEAYGQIIENREVDIQGFDIDDKAVRISRKNAIAAGVDYLIHFQQRGVDKLSHKKKYGFIITNPPYGERMFDKDELPDLYRSIGEAYRSLDEWSMYLITSYEDAEKYIGRKADKNRKIYNGMIKTYYYQFLGSKPPKRINPNK